MQTYEQYRETMRAYHFYPLDYKTWLSWQVHYHGKEATDYDEKRKRESVSLANGKAL